MVEMSSAGHGEGHGERDQPGLTTETLPRPDCGEDSYVGSGRLMGRVALITGGDSGIGRAVAIAFAREGADVAISYLPEEEQDARSTADLVRAAGRRVALLPGDIRDETHCGELVGETVAQLGALDILVLNAAYQKDRSGIDAIELSELDRVIRTNLYAPVLIARAAVPRLRAGSAIIVTTSIQAYDPSPGLFDYAATKAALANLPASLARELGPRGIRVNAVAPGPIWTPLIPATGWPPEKVRDFGLDTPLGRAGQPAELAGAYVYLASDAASYVSGAILPVTGGRPL